MTKAKAARSSFTLRLQPYEGSLLAEVVQYLNALDRAEAQRRVESVLVMALLTQARLEDASRSPQERRRCCIEACDALEKHASTLRQLVGVEAVPTLRSVVQPYEITAGADRSMPIERSGQRLSQKDQDQDQDQDQDETDLPTPKARLKAKAAPQDADALFGG